MRSGEVYELLVDKTGKPRIHTASELKVLAERPDLFHVISHIPRPGATWFAMKLEFDHFPPRTAVNDEFDIRVTRFPDVEGGHLWSIISIPLVKKGRAVSVAAVTGMRLANGVPTAFGVGNFHGVPAMGLGSMRPQNRHTAPGPVFAVFPMDNDRVWSLENDKHSLVYGGQVGQKRLAEEEQGECKRIMAAFRAGLN